MNEAPRYEIKAITDLFNVPDDRREACLKDLALWLAMAEPMRKLLAEIGGVAVFPVQSFIWLDDGKHDAHVSVRVRGTEEEVLNVVIPGGDA